MSADIVEPVHREGVTTRTPPMVFGAVRGLARLGTLALPSETISFASLATGAVLFGLLSFSETERFFFRMSSWWLPLALSAGAFAVSTFIAWRGSLRPGPVGPRWWALALTMANAVLALAAAAAGLLLTVPRWLADPYPLHALSLSAALATVVLIPRLIPTHPLRSRVQLVAPVSLAVVVSAAWITSANFINKQVTQERGTILTMADALTEAADALGQAALADYVASLAGDEVEQRRIDILLDGMSFPGELPLPDPRRWQAAGVLERTGELPKGTLDRAVRELIDTIAAAATTSALPVARGGRFRWNHAAAGYVEKADPAFEKPADIVLRYYSAVNGWFPTLDELERFQDAHSAEWLSRAREGIAERVTALRRRATTTWMAMRLESGATGAAEPPNLAKALEAPLVEGYRPLIDAGSWATLTWRRAVALRGEGVPCEVFSPRVSNRQPIPAPDDQLTELQRLEQLEGTATYYIGQRFDVSSLVRCFTYHPPMAGATDPDDLLVVEMRLQYTAHREFIATTPCRSPQCGSGTVMPQATSPSLAALIVDIPPRAGADYADQIASSVTSALTDKTLRVTRETETQPDGRKALRFVLTRTGE